MKQVIPVFESPLIAANRPAPSSSPPMSRAVTLPRPILKQSSGTPTPVGTPSHSLPKHAHFPPEEVFRRISGIEYDRTPIIVDQNECALPARGCPGRTFDGTELDLHHYRHSSKKSSRFSDGVRNPGNHVHPNYFVAASQSAASSSMNMPADLRDCPLAFVANPGPMPSLSMIHGDTSESDADEIGSPISGPDGYPTLLPESISKKATVGDETRRLRKAQTTQPTSAQRASSVKTHGNRLHRTIDIPPPSPSSTFEYPGSNSCLGGF